jgi:flagella basal body P-ring formation protein FlgA
MTRTLLLAIAALSALGAAAAAADQDRPRLKAEAIVTGSIVRVGDLVENAGIIAKVPIFRAPDLGSTGTVSADAVIEAVRKQALVGLDTDGISEVTVTRASRAIPLATVTVAIAQSLAAQYAMGLPRDISLSFDRELQAIQVEPDAVGEPQVGRIAFDKVSGRFDVTLSVPTHGTSRGNLHLSGQAMATAELVTLTRPIERGEIVKEADIATERRPRASLEPGLVTERAQAVGLAARTSLAPGRPLKATDLMRPALVQRNETVTIVYEVPGITLTVRGKATDAGAEGDVIGVLNEQSKRTVQAVVVGPGRVMISTSAPRLAANIEPAQ